MAPSSAGVGLRGLGLGAVALGRVVTIAVGGVRAVAGLAASAATAAAPATAAARRRRRRSRPRSRPSLSSVVVGSGAGPASTLSTVSSSSSSASAAAAASAASWALVGRRRRVVVVTVGCGTWKSGTAAGASSTVSGARLGRWPSAGASAGGAAVAFLRVRLAFGGASAAGSSTTGSSTGAGGLLGRGLLRWRSSWPLPSSPGPSWPRPSSSASRPPCRPRCRLGRQRRRREWASRRAWSAPLGRSGVPLWTVSGPATRRLRAATQSLRSAATPSAVCVTGGLASPAAVAGPEFRSATVTRTPRPRRGLATIGPRVCQPRSGCGRDGRERRRVEPAGSRSGRRQYRTTRSGVRPFRRHPSGSPTSPVAGSRGPWRSRVSSGGVAGRSPATVAETAQHVVGTDGGHAVAQGQVELGPAGAGLVRTDRQRHHGLAAVEVAQALLGHPLDRDRVQGEVGRHRGRDLLLGQRHHHEPAARLQPVGQGAAGRPRPPRPRRARRGATSTSARRTSSGSVDLGERDLEVLGLAGRPGGRGARVGDPRVRVEARGVRHRDPRPEHRPLEGSAEVTVAGEPQATTLGVADPQPLDGRGFCSRGCGTRSR